LIFKPTGKHEWDDETRYIPLCLHTDKISDRTLNGFTFSCSISSVDRKHSSLRATAIQGTDQKERKVNFSLVE